MPLSSAQGHHCSALFCPKLFAGEKNQEPRAKNQDKKGKASLYCRTNHYLNITFPPCSIGNVAATTGLLKHYTFKQQGPAATFSLVRFFLREKEMNIH
ncbi:hypothetical protein SAMN04487890_11687 [Mucilaginibacter polytrichastri]|nr:hypothetical protein SAMN04487890_11687 [Mucilaginibacter polytrichastri]